MTQRSVSHNAPSPATAPLPVRGRRASAGQQRAAQQGGLIQSSLDIVWSYSRSHAYIGSNLPSSPSFVSRYRRPSWAEAEGSTPSSRRPSHYSDDGSEEGSSSHRRPSEVEEDEEEDGEEEARPRNAVRRPSQPRAVRFRSPDERSPLLQRAQQPRHPSALARDVEQTPSEIITSQYLSASPPDSVPWPRRAPGIGERMSDVDDEAVDDEEIDYSAHRKSNFIQSLFNSVNVLVGVGLLAQPLAFAQAGWILGPMVLLFCCIATNYTAKILARMLAEDSSLMTYSDIGQKAFGNVARILISCLFCLELAALSVALIDLFSDSMSELLPPSTNAFKVICFFVVLPTVFMPLRYISFASLIGIISSFTILLVLVIDGGMKTSSPGSLRDPMPTSIRPDLRFPLSFGLLMSGFGGHAVMPSIARDMADPAQFGKMIDIAYLFTGAVYSLAGCFGYLMFGNDVSDEVTRNLYNTPGYPKALGIVALVMIAINPLAKFALSTAPLHDTIEYFLGVDAHRSLILKPTPRPDDALAKAVEVDGYDDSGFGAGDSTVSLLSATPLRATMSHIVVKTVTTALLVGLAIVLPGFDRVMAFLGAFAAFVISVIGPLAAHLKLDRVGRAEKVLDVVLLIVAGSMALTGTVWTFLPLERWM